MRQARGHAVDLAGVLHPPFDLDDPRRRQQRGAERLHVALELLVGQCAASKPAEREPAIDAARC